MSSQGVSRCCPWKEASGLFRDSMRVPSTFSITMQFGSKIERLSCPGKSVTSRSTLVVTVITTLLRASPLLFTNQIAPVIDAATFTDFTLLQRSRPPCAFTARFSNSFMMFLSWFYWSELPRRCGLRHYSCLYGGTHHVGDFLGMRDHRRVAGRDGANRSAHSFGHELLSLRRDYLIVWGN